MLKPQQYLFILGHMRCYSTLLSHLLGSHPDISGYTELHQSYEATDDFKAMRQKINYAYDKKVNSKFLLDKILHSKYQINESIIRSPQVYLIFILRQPEEMIKSVIQMGYRLNKTQWFKQPHAVLNYYQKRLNQLTLYAQQTNNPILFIEAESLINQSTNILESIQKYLQLEEPINPEYTPFKLTGKQWYGDSTSEINSGKINKTPKIRDNIVLSKEIIHHGQNSYDNCKAQLLKIINNQSY